MKLKRFLLIVGIAVILLYSCDSSNNWSLPVYEGPGGGVNNKFFTEDMTNGNHYVLYADLVYEGTNCNVWVERNKGIDTAEAIKAGKEFDGKNTGPGIYGKLKPVFNFTEASLAGENFSLNTLQFANMFCNNTDIEKITILILDIKDGNDPDVYTAGYFWAMDFFGPDLSYYNQSWFSNECPMLYINKKLLEKPEKAEELYTTIAHETQHLMNFTADLAIRSKWSKSGTSVMLTELNMMDTWINEGLSAAAEYLYSEEFSEERVKWFNSDPYGTITKGNNFYVWAPYSSSTPATILDDYATAYYFFQWLRLQSNGTTIYNNIITSPSYDYQAVIAAAGKSPGGIDSSYNNITTGWGLLLRDWSAANYRYFADSETGRYGYKGLITKKYLKDSKTNQDIKKIFYLDTLVSNTTNWPLAPGGGVYTKKSMTLSAQSGYIRYAGWSGTAPIDSGTTSNFLLSYNINTDTEGSSANCAPFSMANAASSDVSVDTVSRSIIQERQERQPIPGGPYAISAGDMRVINGLKDDSSSLNTRTISREIRKGE